MARIDLVVMCTPFEILSLGLQKPDVVIRRRTDILIVFDQPDPLILLLIGFDDVPAFDLLKRYRI